MTPIPMPADKGADAPERLDLDVAGEILTLQRAAYLTEALAHGDLWLPPLTQSLAEVRNELASESVTAWGFRDAGRLVAAVRVDVDRDEVVARVSGLVVAPDRHGQGLARRLLVAAEPGWSSGVSRMELFTGEHSLANLRLYHRLGYREIRRTPAGAYQLVHLSKILPSTKSVGTAHT